MTSVQIVDDEPLARRRLRRMVEEISGFECVAEAENGYAAIGQFHKLTPEVVLLDVRMPEVDGLCVADYLAKQPQPPGVIFTTAYERYAINAFDISAVDYLLKPVQARRLAAALDKALQSKAHNATNRAPGTTSQHTLCLHDQGQTIMVNIAEVIFCRAEQKYTCIACNDGDYWVDDSLRSLAGRFNDSLTQIHRGILVNKTHVRGIKTESDGTHWVLLRDVDQRLPISRRHLASFRRWLKTVDEDVEA